MSMAREENTMGFRGNGLVLPEAPTRERAGCRLVFEGSCDKEPLYPDEAGDYSSCGDPRRGLRLGCGLF